MKSHCMTKQSQPLSFTVTQLYLVTHTYHNTFTHKNHTCKYTQNHQPTHIITPQTNMLMALAALSFCQTIMFPDAVCVPNFQRSSGWLNPLLTVTPQQTLTLAFPSTQGSKTNTVTTFCQNKRHNLLRPVGYKYIPISNLICTHSSLLNTLHGQLHHISKNK